MKTPFSIRLLKMNLAHHKREVKYYERINKIGNEKYHIRQLKNHTAYVKDLQAAIKKLTN